LYEMRLPFRPRRKVIDPWGSEWELRVSRVVLPVWKEGAYNSFDDASPIDGPAFMLELPIALLGFVWSSILLPMLRFVILTPFAIVRGRRTQAARIEAICWFPVRETRTWATTLDQAASVLNQIALGIEEGKVVQPIGAVYTGTREDG
jgi:hypothetical protein